MHLGNGIICPVTGIPMLAIAGATAFYAYKKARKDFTKDKIMPAVALTLLVFALQMINFAIPFTGSSGHIVGAVLLTALIGPSAGFLAICSVLLVQALFFADGGLLALGCNIFNMGIIPCFMVYPLFSKMFKNNKAIGAFVASIIALQLGSIAVVLEAWMSGSVAGSAIGNFTLLMQAIHLPIGIAEGAVTAMLVALADRTDSKVFSYISGALALVLAVGVAGVASSKPDGLEWSLLNISDSVIMQTQNVLYPLIEAVQTKTAVLADMALIPANILGMLAVGALMSAVSFVSTVKTVKENAD